MKVTVRTLDSKSTHFEVDEKATVKDFKEKVSPELGIAADRQRIIFKGKVLHDEKLLKEYNVDGCVVHLVERQPPTSNASSTADARPTDSSNRRPHGGGGHNGGQPNVFIGAFQGGRDEMGNGTQMGDFYLPQIVESLMSSFGGGEGAATVSTTSVGDATAVNVQINMHSDGQHSHTTDAQMRLRHAQNFIRSAHSRLDALEASVTYTRPLEEGMGNESRTPNEAGVDSPLELTNSPQSFSRVIRNFQNLYQRLEPSLSRYRDMLENPASEMVRQSDDALPDRIAEIIHNMSHAMHALSDVTFNFQSPDPQRLSCLPRMNPVSVPLSSNAPPPSSNTQSDSTTAPTTSSSARSVGQPFVQFSSFLQNMGQRTGAGSSSTFNTPSQTPRPIVTPQVGRPIGVSATVIQIPTQLRTVRTAAPPQHSSVSMDTTTATHDATSTPSAPSSTGTTFTTGASTLGSFAPFDLASMLSSAASSTSQSAPSSQARPSAGQQPTATPHLPRLPFGLDALYPNPVSGHPDPAVPCQSFHFGPRFERTPGDNRTSRPQVFAELSSVVIEHIHSGIPADAPSSNAQTHSSATGSARVPGQTSSTSTAGMTGPSQTTNSAPGHASAQRSRPTESQTQQSASNQEAAFGSQIYEVVQRAVMSSLMGQGQGGQNSPTIRDLFGEEAQELLNSNEQQSNDFISDLFEQLSNHMTIDDIIELVLGTSLRPLRRLAPHVRQFVETKFNNEQPLTRSNIPSVVDKIVGSGLRSTSEAVASLTVRPDIDLEATINNLDREILNDALISLLDYDRADFPDEFAGLFYRYLATSVSVLDSCVEGSAETYLRAVLGSERLSATMRMLNSVNPGMRDMFVDFVISKLRAAAARGPRIPESEIQRRCVKKSDQKKDPSSSKPATLPRAASSTDAPMDLSQRWNELYGNCNEDSGDEGCSTISPEPHEWHRHVPPEWISVITKDAKRQRAQTPQRPFSDSYCSGLPAKRRKAAKSDEDSYIDFKIAVQNSIKSTKAQPKTSLSELSRDLDSEELRNSFHATLRNDTRERLEKDPDYKPEKFPNSDEYFFPEK